MWMVVVEVRRGEEGEGEEGGGGEDNLHKI